MQFKIGLCNVTLVDTPGFDDTNRTDTEILRLIASWMKDAYDDKTRLTGIIFLHRISDNKMSGSSYKNLKLFRSLCGSENLSHVILATTMWDKVTPEEGAAREAELLLEDKWWGQMKNQGSMVRRYDNTTGGAMAMVNELLQKAPMILKIQNEMAIQKISLIDTVAGRSINAALNDLSKKYQEDLAEIKADLAQAVKDSKQAFFSYSSSSTPFLSFFNSPFFSLQTLPPHPFSILFFQPYFSNFASPILPFNPLVPTLLLPSTFFNRPFPIFALQSSLSILFFQTLPIPSSLVHPTSHPHLSPRLTQLLQ